MDPDEKNLFLFMFYQRCLPSFVYLSGATKRAVNVCTYCHHSGDHVCRANKICKHFPRDNEQPILIPLLSVACQNRSMLIKKKKKIEQEMFVKH